MNTHSFNNSFQGVEARTALTRTDKLTNSGCRITKNGIVINSVEEEAMQKTVFQGASFKENGTYYFYNRRQGKMFIYLDD